MEQGKPACSLLCKGNRCNLAWSPLTRFYQSAGAARVNQHAKTSFSLSLAGVVSILVDPICHFYEFPCQADKKYWTVSEVTDMTQAIRLHSKAEYYIWRKR